MGSLRVRLIDARRDALVVGDGDGDGNGNGNGNGNGGSFEILAMQTSRGRSWKEPAFSGPGDERRTRRALPLGRQNPKVKVSSPVVWGTNLTLTTSPSSSTSTSSRSTPW